MRIFTSKIKVALCIVLFTICNFSFSQTSEVVVTVQWPGWSTECKVEIYAPGGGTPILTMDNGYDGSSDSSYGPTSSNMGCKTDNLNIPSGTGYYAKVFERYGDGWNGGGTLNITSGAVNVLSYNENLASDANDLDNGGSGEVTQILYFAVTNGGAACSVGPEINVTGSSNTISDNDNTPSASDGTNFGSVYHASGSVSRTFTVQNLGSSALSLVGSPRVSVIGGDSANFVVTSQPSSSVGAGSSSNFTVTFNPVSVGTKTVSLSILNNDTTGSESPYNFNITGVGSAVASVSPGNISNNLQLWMKADTGTSTTTNGQAVTSWGDNSPNSFTAVKGATNSPTYQNDIINFNPAIRFNSSRSQKKYFKIPTATISGTGLDITPSPTSPTFAKRSSMSIFAAFLTDGSGAGTMFSRATNGNGRSYQLWLGDRDRVVHYTLGRSASASGQSDPNSGINFGITHARNDPKISSVTVDINGASTDTNNSNTNKILRYVNGYSDPLTVHTDGNNGFGPGESTNMDVLIGARRDSDNTNTGNELIGDVAEIIVYNRALSATERQKVETYLAIKYGITLGYNDEYYKYNVSPSEITTFGYSGSSNDYMLSDGSTAWDGSANAGYGYNVFGVARDDISGLLQLKSKSVHVDEFDGTYIDDVDASPRYFSVLTMEDESGTINTDKGYLLVGNNGAAVQLQSSSVPERVFSTINRVWKSRESSSDVGTVKLDFDLSQFSISGSSDLELIVSKNSNLTNYKNYAGTYNSSTKIVSFAGVDLDDAEYFTLAKVQELEDDYHFDFNGSSKYVDLGDKFDLTGHFTISAWIKRNSNNDRSIFSKRNSGDTQGYDFKINSSGRLEMYWYNGSKQSVVSDTYIPTGKWHHVAAIYDGKLTLYIDGVMEKGLTKSSPIGTSHSALIGAAGGTSPSKFYNGDIDELRIWNVALEEEQLHYIMNQEIQNSSGRVRGSYFQSRGITPSNNEINSLLWNNLIGYFPFSHVRGNCLFNESNYTNYNGRLYNTSNASIEGQTAPLPYKSANGGNWKSASTWVNGSVQNIPGHTSLKNTSTRIVGNIVEIDHNITMDNSLLTAVDSHKNRTLLALFVDSNKLTVTGTNGSSGNGLTISHYLSLDGIIDLNGESQLIQSEQSDLKVGSQGKLERDQQGTKDLYTYNYWSSPVGLTSMAQNDVSFKYKLPNVIKNGTIPTTPNTINFVNGYNGSVSGSNISIASYWVWKFANRPDDDYSSWQHVRHTGDLNPGEGFTMKGVSNTNGSVSQLQNYVFNGKPNNGDIELDLWANHDYLVGNPYASAIDAEQFILDNGPTIKGNGNTTGTLYFWEHWGGGSHVLAEYQGGYATYNLSGGVPAALLASADPDVDQSSLVGTQRPGRYIPVGQGFFVVGEANGKIKFNNGQRVFRKEGNSSSVFLKGTNKTEISEDEIDVDDRIKIRLGLNSVNTIHRQLLVTVDERATIDYDWGFDGKLNDDQMDDMFWMIQDGKYVIQGINEIDETETVLPIGIKTNIDGVNSITIDDLENVPTDLQIFLHDKEDDTYQDLRVADYSVTLSAGEYLNRFEVVFSTQESLSVIDNEVEDLSFYYAIYRKKIVILNPTHIELKSIELYNIAGQSVYSNTSMLEGSYSEYEIHNLSAGAYIVKLSTIDNNVITKKIIVK